MNKVFFLGFNKTATCALHELFLNSGYNSCHERDGDKHLAKIMHENHIQNKNVLDTIDQYEVYSDLNYNKENVFLEGNEFYKELDEQYPNSYFILQFRDVKSWIESRSNHNNNYIERARTGLKLKTIADVKLHWKKTRHETHKDIKQYFDCNKRFMTFNINKDDIYKVINHVKDDYVLDAKHFNKVNVTNYEKNR
jgi:hypothetical protein